METPPVSPGVLGRAHAQRVVALCVGDKAAEDTKFMWRYAYAHLLEPDDRAIVLHVRLGAPAGWVPLNVGQPVGGEEASWLPDEMRDGLKAFPGAEYWQLKGLTPGEAIQEFGASGREGGALALAAPMLSHYPHASHPTRAARQSRRAACALTCWSSARAARAASSAR